MWHRVTAVAWWRCPQQDRVLVHAAPGQAKVEIIAANDRVVARGDLDRHGEYSPMTLVERDGSTLHRSEVWPTEELYGLPVLLSGGEVGLSPAMASR